MKNVCQKVISPPLAINQMSECFGITLSKWIKYENRLTFIYYSKIFWDFESLQSVSKTWQVLKTKKNFLKKMSKYRNTFFWNYQSRFLVIFSSNYRHHLVLKIPFPDHIFPKISKYRTENFYCPSTSKCYAPPTVLIIWHLCRTPPNYLEQRLPTYLALKNMLVKIRETLVINKAGRRNETPDFWFDVQEWLFVVAYWLLVIICW